MISNSHNSTSDSLSSNVISDSVSRVADDDIVDGNLISVHKARLRLASKDSNSTRSRIYGGIPSNNNDNKMIMIMMMIMMITCKYKQSL